MNKALFLTLLFAITVVAAPCARALEMEGVRIDDKVVLESGSPELVLNGAGVRHKLVFVKVYIGSLYLAKKNSDRDAVLADPGPKRISMHILSNEVTASDLIASMNNALAANLVPHELALIEKRNSALNAMMATVKTINKGSVVHLDYIPKIGTRITINGQEKLILPGDDFFRAMMHIWIGNHPVDGRLRDAMLGKASKLF